MPVSKRLRYEILKRDKHRCKYCGASSDDVVLRIDHVIPVALGGSDDPSNLRAACHDCNAGKSSVPVDAPLVAEVAADALRWAQAMEVVAGRRAEARKEARSRYKKFQNGWKAWYSTNWRGEKVYVDLPGDWERSVDQFLDAGLDMDDLLELINVAMGCRTTNDEWRYFCGCCWKRIKQNQEMAAEIIAQDSPAPQLQISTRWTEDDLNYLLTLEGVEVNYVGGLFDCEDHAAGLCETDTLCQIVSAARTRESLEMLSVRKWKAQMAEDAINAAADEAEDYVYG